MSLIFTNLIGLGASSAYSAEDEYGDKLCMEKGPGMGVGLGFPAGIFLLCAAPGHPVLLPIGIACVVCSPCCCLPLNLCAHGYGVQTAELTTLPRGVSDSQPQAILQMTLDLKKKNGTKIRAYRFQNKSK